MGCAQAAADDGARARERQQERQKHFGCQADVVASGFAKLREPQSQGGGGTRADERTADCESERVTARRAHTRKRARLIDDRRAASLNHVSGGVTE